MLAQRKVHFDADERDLMIRVLADGLHFPYTSLGRGATSGHWWHVLRIALALSLKLKHPPDETFTKPSVSKAEPRLEQVIGTNSTDEDLSDIFQALISAHQGEDLFSDEDRFVELLQRHLRRGLAEIGAGWRKGNNFFDFVRQELLADIVSEEHESAVQPDKVTETLRELGVVCDLEDRTEGPRLTMLTLRLGSSGDLSRLRRIIDVLPFELGQGHGATFEIVAGQRQVALYLPRPLSTWKSPQSSVGLDAIHAYNGTLSVSPGVTIEGKPFVFDLVEAPHLFVAGQTGSGKSVCIHAVIRSLLSAPEPPLLALVDPKEVEFQRYQNDNLIDPYGEGIVTNATESSQLLDSLVQEMNLRQSTLAKLGATNLAEARARGSSLRYIVLVIDELADLVLTTEEAVNHLIRLSQKSRATGIHLVLATQRPDAETFPGLLRANIPSRIGLAVRSATESRIILDETGAEKLLGRGDMLVKIVGRPVTRLHGFQFDNETNHT